MRTLSDNLISAQAADSYRPCAQLIVERARYYFNDFTQNYPNSTYMPPVAADDDVTALCESAAYSSSLDKVVTVSVRANSLYVQVSGSSGITLIPGSSASVPNHFRPGLVQSSTTPSKMVVFWYHAGANTIFKTTFTPTNPADAVHLAVNASATNDFTMGALHAINEDIWVLFHSKGGGIKVRVYMKQNTGVLWYQNMPNQFLFSNYQITNGYQLNYTAAVCYGSGPESKLAVYVANPIDGSVMTAIKAMGPVYYQLEGRTHYGADWSDIFTAVPTDMSTNSGLSVFRPTHAGVDLEGNPYLVGQFWRTQELASSTHYNMRLISYDQGKSFSFDFASVFTALPYRFHFVYGGGKIFGAAQNRVAYGPACTPFGTDQLIIPQSRLKTFNASAEESQIVLANGDEFYDGVPDILKVGSVARLQLGFYTESGPEYVDYSKYIISGIQRRIGDGERLLTLNLAHYGLWKVSNMSQPYYTEMESKSAMSDDLADYSFVYEATKSGVSETHLTVDFWLAEPFLSTHPPYPSNIATASISFGNGVVTAQSLIGGHNTSCRVMIAKSSGMSQSPTIATLPITVKMYYWSRQLDAGAVTYNDAVLPALLIKKTDGSELEIGGTVSGSNRCPATFPDGTYTAGAEPVIYTFSDPLLVIGDAIEGVSVIFTSPNSTMTYPERLEISGINVVRGDTGETGWTQLIGGGMEVPDFTRPNIMFVSVPDSAFNFEVEGRFQYLPGIESGARVSGASVCYGLVGLAQDAQNYFAAIIYPSTSDVKFVRVVNGIETILYAVNSLSRDYTQPHNFTFKHTNGHFELLYHANTFPGDWVTFADYVWDRTDKMVPWTDMRMGIYGAKVMPYVRIVGFDSDRSNYLAVIPGGDDHLADFPGTGKIMIEGQIYTYSGKVGMPGRVVGPVQFRAQYGNLGRYTEHGFTYGACSKPIDLQYFHRMDNGTQHALYSGYILALEYQGNYKVTDVDWYAAIDGYRWSRSRWSIEAIAESAANTGGATSTTRCYITGGLTGVKHSSGEGQNINHTPGSPAMLYATDRILIQHLSAISGSQDVTVADMIRTVASRSGTAVEFVGDRVIPGISVTATPTVIL